MKREYSRPHYEFHRPATEKVMTTNSASTEGENQTTPSAWKEIVAKYQRPSVSRAVWQIVNTLVPYAALWYLMYFTLAVSYWLVVPLAILAGGFMMRLFIIHHDCGHGSFFESRRANDIWGFITGVLTFTPYYHWRWEHAAHHSTSGDLDRRGMGDIWTLTVQEYLESSRWKRFAYRLARRRERHSVYWTNLAILGMAAGVSWIFGIRAYLVIQFTAMAVAGSAGVWLFYVQHQFDGVYWERSDEWDYAKAALQGSSFYKLPKVLQWFSGNIGFHHIHHLSPRIPNYHLEKCHQAEPLFQTVKPVTLLSSFKSFTFRLWDEQRRKLVGYGHLRIVRRQKQQTLLH